MSFSYRGDFFDKRGCYIILPASPFGRCDSNDNTADADEEVEVLEGPEVEIVDLCELDDEEGEANMDSESNETSSGNDAIDLVNTIQDSQAGPLQSGAIMEPDNRFYEVEAIIAGPKKRREHLFKLCYKVRWKGYGEEADTWQPLADLANVQDMIEEYKKERAEEARQKRKQFQKPVTDCSEANSSFSDAPAPQTPAVAAAESDSEDESHQYDPEYGTVKDKFWKDLELGRHQNHAQLFAGDMYSKVKGCRRAAHAEAVANIHKQQHQLHNKTPIPALSPKSSTPKTFKRQHREDRGARRAVNLSSRLPRPSGSVTSPKLSPVRARKRSSDPFSARGYMSSKRSRRSREMRGGNQSPEKRSSVSSVTSETVGIVSTSSDLVLSSVLTDTTTDPSFPVTSADNRSMQESKPDTVTSVTAVTCAVTSVNNSKKRSCCYGSDEDIDSVFSPKPDESNKMVVSSETMLTVTTESQRLEEGIIRPEEIFKLKTDENFLPLSNSLGYAGASGSESVPGAFYGASGATSRGSAPGPSGLNPEEPVKRSTLDTQSEASGAIENSHDQVCMWGGACNRSDCKANRRRNMKNGKGEDTGGENCKKCPQSNSSVPSGSSTSDRNRGENSSYLESSPRSHSNPQEENSSPPHQNLNTRVNISAHQSPSPGPKSSKKNSGPSKTSTVSNSHSQGQSRRSLFSSVQTYSSDSSFEESINNNVPLSREVVSDSFKRMDALAQRMHMDTIASSSLSRATTLVSSTMSSEGSIHQSHLGGRRSNESEQSGLYRDNKSAFNFARQDSGFSGGSSTPGDLHALFTLPSPTGSINLCSPGKENFGSSAAETSRSSMISSHERLHSRMDVDTTDSRPDTSTSSAMSAPNDSRTFVEPQEGRSSRKRASDIPQPLEKIPSPNSRRDSDLDRRIGTLTCDELEDFQEQGDERFGHKDVGFVTNADLLQAVNLSKAEVVRRAIRQSSSCGHKLDFEQPDNAGITLLMRAVQKGTVAIVEMLLEHGVNVNAQQTNGVTALMFAAEQNGVCLVALLLKHGANSSLYTVHSDQAETALMKAIKRQQVEVVNLMLRVGVNIAAPTCTSISVLELAIQRRNHQIETIVQTHCQRLEEAFRNRVLATLEETADLMEPLFPLHCFPLRESQEFTVRFNSNIHPVSSGEGFLLFIAHTKINDKGVRCRFHGGCPIASVTLNGVVQSPLTEEVNFVTSCHPIITGCNTLVIHKLADYTSKAKLVVQAFRARLLS